MALRIKSEVSSRKWSCSTLEDGIDQLLSEANQVDEEEENLMKAIEDLQGFDVEFEWRSYIYLRQHTFGTLQKIPSCRNWRRMNCSWNKHLISIYIWCSFNFAFITFGESFNSQLPGLPRCLRLWPLRLLEQVMVWRVLNLRRHCQLLVFNFYVRNFCNWWVNPLYHLYLWNLQKS